MISKFKPVSISLSPNVQKDDVVLALKLLFQPWKWKKGPAIAKLETGFKKYLGANHAYSFNSGRSALFAILKALDLPEGSDVLLQAFTCNAVANPILWAKLNPIYVDCANDFNMDIEDLKRKITLRQSSGQAPKVLILQHTFGLPANINEVLSIVRQHNIFLIEDCAHALGAKYQGKPVGSFGDAAFFSFSRDKVVSSVYGGLASTDDGIVGAKLQKLQQEFGQPSLFWIRQQIMHPVLLHYVILPLYAFIDLGKLFLIASQWLQILSKAVSWQEKRGQRPDYFPKALPNALALMAENQIHKMDAFNAYRKSLAQFYAKELAGTKFGLPIEDNNLFLRFAVTHPKAHEIIYQAWHKENILLGDWYTSAVAPQDTQLDKMAYIPGSCPKAEALAQITLNLPTHINISTAQAQRIINFLQPWK